MIRLVILGGGGHSQVVSDIVRCVQLSGTAIRVVGHLDDAPALQGKKILDSEVLGPIGWLSRVPHDSIVIAIGENRVRKRLYEELRSQGEHLVTVCHPESVVASDVTVGLGCVICAGVVVNTGSSIGDNVILNTGCQVDHHNLIGSHSHLAPGVCTGGDAVVGEGALMGLRSSLMPRRRVGDWATVGAGAVVCRDVSDSQIVVGVPARPFERR